MSKYELRFSWFTQWAAIYIHYWQHLPSPGYMTLYYDSLEPPEGYGV